MAYKRPESVLVVIYNRQGQVLVLQRKDDPEFWQSVTGSMEEGESPAQTAIREVKEETGIDIALLELSLVDCQQQNQYQIRPQWRHRYAPGTETNLEHAFCLQVPDDCNIALTEHLSYQWLAPEMAAKKVWSDSNKKVIREHLLQGHNR